MIVEDSDRYFVSELLDKDGNPIIYERPTVEWFGFVPQYEKED